MLRTAVAWGPCAFASAEADPPAQAALVDVVASSGRRVEGAVVEDASGETWRREAVGLFHVPWRPAAGASDCEVRAPSRPRRSA